jgi:uncharacterized protein YdaU (DUF1376 family)
MAKAPAFQFYVADYMQDTRMVSLAARGAWMDLLCTMWRSQNRGQVTSTIIGYARLFGCTVEQAQSVIDELIESGVCNSVTERDGKVTLKNRRMSREAKGRENANIRQQKYRERHGDAGNNGTGDAQSNAEVTPPSSSSSSYSPNGEADTPPPEGVSHKKPPDPRTKHPAIQAVRRHLKSYPDVAVRDDVIAALGDAPDEVKLAECRRTWVTQGFNPQSLIWAIDWYVTGIPDKFGKATPPNGSGRAAERHVEDDMGLEIR